MMDENLANQITGGFRENKSLFNDLRSIDENESILLYVVKVFFENLKGGFQGVTDPDNRCAAFLSHPEKCCELSSD